MSPTFAVARTEERLRALKAIELIYEKSVFPEVAYVFKHALTVDYRRSPNRLWPHLKPLLRKP